MATRTTPPSRRLSMLSAPTRQAVEFSDAVTAAGGVMPTGGAFSTANNPWLKKYGATLTDFDDRVAFTAAQGIADKNNAKAGGARLTGGYEWGQFDDFHNVRSQEERLKGNRYSVGTIQGGGDINQRPLDGSGPTRQVNGGSMPAAALSSLRRVAEVSDPNESVADYQHRREMERLSREAGTETVRAGRLANDATVDGIQGARDALNMAPGTQGWYDAQRSRSGLKNELAYDATLNAADAESDAYWKHGRSALVDKSRLQDEAGLTAHSRAMELQGLRSAPALAAVGQRQATGAAATDQRAASSMINALTQQINNARQYGDDETVTQLQPALDALIAQARAGLQQPGPPARGMGAGPAGAGAGMIPPRPPGVPPEAEYDPTDGGWYITE